MSRVKKKAPKLYVKKLVPHAKLPQVAHPGSDLAYDLFAAEDVTLTAGRVTKVKTGVAIEFDPPHGAIFKDRSSMAAQGIRTSGGVLDAGYRGELVVMLTLDTDSPPTREDRTVFARKINAGDKIAQMIPVLPNTSFVVEEKKELSDTVRGEKGFGSTGK